jgi:molybdate transport system substrate-binding protein
MKKIYRAILLFLFVCLMQAPVWAAGQDITVSAAMSLKNAFEEIGKLYYAKTGVKVIFNFGASGGLIRQIVAGAPVDVFASADLKDMDVLTGKGLALPSSKRIFAGNSLVLVAPVNSGTQINKFSDLDSQSFRRIAVCNPKTSPAGRYAEMALLHYRVADRIKDRLIYTENVRQSLDYVARGEVDAGIVYLTDAIVRAKEVRVVATAAGVSHKPIVYPIAVVKGTQNESLARGFISETLSKEGRKILQKHGFSVDVENMRKGSTTPAFLAAFWYGHSISRLWNEV